MEACGFRVSNISCCVVGCHNSYANTEKNVKFYRFPNRPYEVERKKIWIQRVRRKTSDGKVWKPKPMDRICSAHFANNEKSNIITSPSYNPTIFPDEYKYRPTYTKTTHARAQRVAKLSRLKQINSLASTSQNEEPFVSQELINDETEYIDVACQVNFEDKIDQNNNFFFECTFSKENNEVSVQANVVRKHNELKIYADKSVGNNEDVRCSGFHGYESVSGEEQLSSLSGVSSKVFNLLLSLSVVTHGNDRLNERNQLLLFLMKLKLGISFTGMGVLFNIHRSTVSRIFFCKLDEFYQKTSEWIFWPTRNVISNTMPKAFTINYPTCRVIIDCTEIKIEQPSSVENRIYCYSQYKGTFTAKVLIGVAPNGFITFLSKSYGGRSSDAFITNDCGILNLLQPGDTVLADKGFPGIKCQEGVIIVMPPFVHDGRLTVEEVEKTYTVASVRIHVERSIQRIKTFNILQKLSSHLFPHIDKILTMCCVLANLQPPIIKTVDE